MKKERYAEVERELVEADDVEGVDGCRNHSVRVDRRKHFQVAIGVT